MTAPVADAAVDILLVEDNPGDVRLVQEAFRETDLDTRFHVATDGTEALSLLRGDEDDDAALSPDLLLLDLNLPRTDGFAVLEAIRDDSEYPTLPTLVLTSSEQEEDILRCYELSANAYLTKPDGPDEFAALGETIEKFWFEQAKLPPVSP